ncbi:prepilin-type N-terminal cleavage/methylation domain-containing protein [bacterium SCSIO 12696]|nr:prepilin-type N-terminal cleavage/methylation domain-containing protein [bacterium SCSIO 12696]
MNRFQGFTPHTVKGLSLVELMISITLVSIILAGVVKLYSDSHRSSLANEGVARTQEGIRYVLDHISRSAARAGYMGCAQFNPQGSGDSSNVLNFIDTSTDTGRLYDFEDGPVFGTNDNGLNGSDTLVLRSAITGSGVRVTSSDDDSVTVDAGELAASGIERGDVVIVSDCANINIFMVTSDPESTNVLQHSAIEINDVSNVTIASADRTSEEDENPFGRSSLGMLFPATGASVAYSIETSVEATTACSNANPESCALFSNGEELLQGVENLQVRFGERTGNSVRYRDPDVGIDWQEVVSVELTLTMNSVDRAFSRQDGVDGGGDGLVRKNVTHVVALRNGVL